MINLAGKKNCDDFIIKELTEAGIEYQKFNFAIGKGEVPSKIMAHFQGWTFSRAWYYWCASTDCTPLLFKHADPLHKVYGQDVRVAGHCGCPSPQESFKEKWHIGVNSYHVDSQEGLNELIKTISKQTVNI